MIKEFLNSKRVWIILAGVLLLLANDALNLDLAQETMDRALLMLAGLAGLDGWNPLGKPRAETP